MKNIAIFASGSGTNAENIIRYFINSENVNISLIVTDNPSAFVLERARSLAIETAIFKKSDFRSEGIVLPYLENHGIDFIVLAGFLSMIPTDIIEAFPQAIVNIHPALLPRHGGKGMYGMRVHQAVIEAHEAESGITIHYINEHYDEGTVVFQSKCPVLSTDTPEDVARKVHELEYEHYPRVIERLVNSMQ